MRWISSAAGGWAGALRQKRLWLALALAVLSGCGSPTARPGQPALVSPTPPVAPTVPVTQTVAAAVTPSTSTTTPNPSAALTPTAARTLPAPAVPVPGDPLTGTGQVARLALTADQLTAGPGIGGLVPDSAFALPAAAAPPSHAFEGQLNLSGAWLNGGLQVLRDDFGLNQLISLRGLPDLSLSFVQNGSFLIPVQPGLIITGHPFWNLIVGPGRVWDEAGDAGDTRASFPITLVERNISCTHNGTVLFLFNDRGVSRAQLQVTQETCLYLKFNLWGQLAASYTPAAIPNAAALQASFAREVAGRLPTRPIADFAADFPAAHIDPAALISGLTREHVTAYGLLVNGTNYVGDCQTRSGSYAYCQSLRLSSYSIAKSAFAAVALMRLGQLYGAGVYAALIRDYVPESAQSPGGWAGVTFENALDMATGYYQSAAPEADENDPAFQLHFIVAESYAEKLAAAFSYPRRRAPGQVWVYHSSDTFVLTQAMNAYLKSKAGPQADIFNLVRDDVYIPLGLSAGALTTLRTDNRPDGAPIGAYGLFLTVDDIAKIARLLNNDHGRINGQPVLEPGLLAASLQQNPADRGLDTTGSLSAKYNHGFWALHTTQPCAAWVPFMSGYGGIIVALLPNGSSYYYFSDNNEYNWLAAVDQSSRLASLCP